MKVSIVIPVYNKAEFISSCIESLLQQDFDDFEIIAVDDGSTDDSGKICDDKAAQDARIRVIHTENGGVTAARRKGVEQAAGEYIMFVDADDQLLPDAIKILYTAITVNHADEVIGRFKTQNGDVSPIVYRDVVTDVFPLVRDIVSNKNKFPILWGLICRKDVIIDCFDIPRDIIEGEDLLTQLHILVKHPRVVFITDCVYMYTEGLPNTRKRTLELEKTYDAFLHKLLLPEWEKYEASYVLRQIKQYQRFIIHHDYGVRQAYYDKVIPSRLPAAIPLFHKLTWYLPPMISRLMVKCYRRILGLNAI